MIASSSLVAWLSFGVGVFVGALATVAFFLASLLTVALVQPARSLHRQAARELNQALADYFGVKELDENDALLVRLRASAHAHHDALVEFDRVNAGAEAVDRAAGDAAVVAS